jgi:hypothetical protein
LLGLSNIEIGVEIVKFLRASILSIAFVALVALVSLKGFTYWFWSEWDIGNTLDIFQNNKNLFNELVVWADDRASQDCIKKYNSKECLPKQFRGITKYEVSISYAPFIVEAAPVNFYYVLVYTKQDRDINQSGVYQDEGEILRKIDRSWTLVRRGWM